MLKRALATVAVILVAGVVIPPSAQAARVRVHHHQSQPAPIKVNIPDLPAIDYKGLTNADALTVAISRTTLLSAAAPFSKPLGNLVRGTHLKKLGVVGGYYQVETAGKKRGFVIKYAVAMGKVTLGASAPTPTGFVVVKAPRCTVYTLPNKTSPVLGTLTAQAKVKFMRSQGTFYQVTMPNGRWGWLEQAAGTLSAK